MIPVLAYFVNNKLRPDWICACKYHKLCFLTKIFKLYTLLSRCNLETVHCYLFSPSWIKAWSFANKMVLSHKCTNVECWIYMNLVNELIFWLYRFKWINTLSFQMFMESNINLQISWVYTVNANISYYTISWYCL